MFKCGCGRYTDFGNLCMWCVVRADDSDEESVPDIEYIIGEELEPEELT